MNVQANKNMLISERNERSRCTTIMVFKEKRKPVQATIRKCMQSLEELLHSNMVKYASSSELKKIQEC